MTVLGPRKELVRFKKAITEEEKDEYGEKIYNILHRLYPIPKCLADSVSPLTIVETQEQADEANEKYKENINGVMPEHIKAITLEEQERRLKEYGAVDWYDWCCTYWGTKWGDCHVSLEDKGDRLFLIFDSAWGPPSNGMAHVSELFPKLYFELEFREPGMCFAGVEHFENGDIVLDEEKEFVDDEELEDEEDWENEEED